MQQLFRLLIFLIQPYMFRATNSPILSSTFWLYIQLLVQCTETAADRCIIPKAVYTVKKCSWGWANLSPETCRAELKKINKVRVVEPCWLFTSLWLCEVYGPCDELILDPVLTTRTSGRAHASTNKCKSMHCVLHSPVACSLLWVLRIRFLLTETAFSLLC